MKVDLVSKSGLAASGVSPEKGTSPAPSAELRSKFEGLLKQFQEGDVLGMRQHQELLVMQQKLSSSTQISARELLLYQVRVGEFGLKVEMISKMSESALGTVKKLQQTQG